MFATLFTCRAWNISNCTPRIDDKSEFLWWTSNQKPSSVVPKSSISIPQSISIISTVVIIDKKTSLFISEIRNIHTYTYERDRENVSDGVGVRVYKCNITR